MICPSRTLLAGMTPPCPVLATTTSQVAMISSRDEASPPAAMWRPRLEGCTSSPYTERPV